MKEITISKIFRNNEKKDGTPYKDKNGKLFKLVTIYPQTKDGSSVRMSYCDYNDITAEWQEGDRVKVKVTKNGEYLNFAPPSKLDELEDTVKALTKRVEALEGQKEDMPTDLPFDKEDLETDDAMPF